MLFRKVLVIIGSIFVRYRLVITTCAERKETNDICPVQRLPEPSFYQAHIDAPPPRLSPSGAKTFRYSKSTYGRWYDTLVKRREDKGQPGKAPTHSCSETGRRIGESTVVSQVENRIFVDGNSLLALPFDTTPPQHNKHGRSEKTERSVLDSARHKRIHRQAGRTQKSWKTAQGIAQASYLNLPLDEMTFC
uniref:Secreted protein n=1 Tax=Steinernema glaseri TaxID=37863 RepID=A0A1I7ZTQ1_9BILA